MFDESDLGMAGPDGFGLMGGGMGLMGGMFGGAGAYGMAGPESNTMIFGMGGGGGPVDMGPWNAALRAGAYDANVLRDRNAYGDGSDNGPSDVPSFFQNALGGGAYGGGGYGGGGGRRGGGGYSSFEEPNIHGYNANAPYYAAQYARQQQDSMASAYAAAKKANEDRYNQILQGYTDRYNTTMNDLGQFSQQGQTDITNQGQQQKAMMEQGAVSRGLGNTTVTDALQRGINTDTQSNLNRFNDQVLNRKLSYEGQQSQDKLGFMERRNDVYPNLGQYASLMQGAGAAGMGYGGGGGSGTTRYAGPGSTVMTAYGAVTSGLPGGQVKTAYN